MDNNWRGRGRGRGRGSYNNNNRDNAFNNNNNHNDNNNHNNNNGGGSSSILSRLGPTNSSFNNNNSNNNNNRHNNNDRNSNTNYNNDSSHQRGSRAFSSNNNRGRGRGYKNFGGDRFNNEFIDEDTSMKSTPAGFVVTISGYPVGSDEKVLGFITRKSKTAWEPLQVDYESGKMHITVADKAVSDDLCRMNNYSFGNAVLSIASNKGYNSRPRGPNNEGHVSRASEILSEFINERWDPSNQHLSLDELPPTTHNVGTVFSRLLSEAKRILGSSVTTISANSNKIWSVVPLQKIPDLFPNLQNLSIADNDIAEFRSLDKLANRLPQLKELILSGNPIQQNNSFDVYKTEVLKRFPSLQILDMQPIGGMGSANIFPSALTNLPAPVRSSFFDQDNTCMVVQDLLSKFFPLFDTNRNSLLDLYDAQAIFSGVFCGGTYQQQTAWGSSQVSPTQRMVLGNENIIKRFAQLPLTVHDLSSADNFVTDAWQTQGSQAHPIILFLTVHGEFAEAPLGTRLSFDRVLLVAPAVPGSR